MTSDDDGENSYFEYNKLVLEYDEENQGTLNHNSTI